MIAMLLYKLYYSECTATVSTFTWYCMSYVHIESKELCTIAILYRT